MIELNESALVRRRLPDQDNQVKNDIKYFSYRWLLIINNLFLPLLNPLS